MTTTFLIMIKYLLDISKNLYKINRNKHNNLKLFYSTGFNKINEEKANNISKDYISWKKIVRIFNY